MVDQQVVPRWLSHPADLPGVTGEVAERSQQIINDWLSRNSAIFQPAGGGDPAGLGSLFLDFATRMMALPANVVTANISLWQDYFTLWQDTTSRMLGRSTTTGAAGGTAGSAPANSGSGAGRLGGADAGGWQDDDVFNYVKRSFLLADQWVHLVCHLGESSEAVARETAEFYAQQFTSVLTASAFAATNPEVIRATVEMQGENLLTGLKNLLGALESWTPAKVRTTGAAGGRVVGTTIATTPGKVIFRNHLIELIQYEPRTERVARRPLLFVPPWIHKYYIFDLCDENSLVRWALEHGRTVMMISWADTSGASAAAATVHDYITDGLMAALGAIARATGERQVDAVGYCLGGTLLAACVAHLAATGDDRIRTATFLAALLDFSQPGELGAITDEATLSSIAEMDAQGAVDASELARTFSLQRRNDLLWSFVVNNYLLGKDAFPQELLHWVADWMPLPVALHRSYLRDFYQSNSLIEPGGVTIGGHPLDLRKVRIPIYFLSAREDHITPWTSIYKAAHILGGPSRFALTASGHFAGIVNPPALNKYCYWTNSKRPADPKLWQSGAKALEGSWWSDWIGWMDARSGGDRIAARRPGEGALKSLGEAPGTYVGMPA